MFTAREASALSLVGAEGIFLVRTSRAWYTVVASRDTNNFVIVSGGTHNRPAERVRIDGSWLIVGNVMSFNEGNNGHSTPVRTIIDITDMSQDDIETIKHSYI